MLPFTHNKHLYLHKEGATWTQAAILCRYVSTQNVDLLKGLVILPQHHRNKSDIKGQRLA